MSQRLFSRRYDVGPEMLLDLVQQVMAGLPDVASFQPANGGDQVAFTTSFTLTSWGENMVAAVEADGPDGSVLTVSGTPRVGGLSSPWGEEMHAATIEGQLFAALEPAIAMAETNPITMLWADHRRVEALFARIGSTSNGERDDLVQQLLSSLRVHMELEETYVYPLLRAEVGDDVAEEAEVEHQLARDGLAQLAELTPDAPGFDAALAMVMAGIEHHVQEEEGEAFPRLVTELGADRLAELAAQLNSLRAELVTRDQRSKGAGRTTTPTRAKANRKGPRPSPSKRPSDRARGPRNKPKAATIDLEDTTKAELVERAKRAGVSGYSNMSKADLAKAISRAK